jgi:hypothetical protein
VLTISDRRRRQWRRWTDNVEYLYVFLIDIFMMVFVGFTMQRAFLRKVPTHLSHHHQHSWHYDEHS